MNASITHSQPVLYAYDICPYCRRVTRFMDKHELVIPIKDSLDDPEARDELVRLGGKSQVPALLVDGEIIYESRAIVAWMEQNMMRNEVMRTA